MRLRSIPAAFLALILPACGASTPTPTTTTDAGTALDVPSAADVATVADTPAATDQGAPIDVVPTADAGGVPTLNGCTPDGYVDQTAGTASDRMIMTRGTTSSFDFPCMTISAGQSVQFMWAFARHPLTPGLAPGEAGTEPDSTPIQAFSTGSVQSIRSPTPGLYPFHCGVHPGTMKGVVQVL